MKNKYTVSEVRQTYYQKKTDLNILHKLVRPLSFYLAVPFLNHGISANQVTYLAFILGVISLIFFSVGLWWTSLLATFLFLTNVLLDHVDGNICRVMNSASYYGKFLDGAKDKLLASFVPFAGCIGIVMQNHQLLGLNPLLILILGGIAGILSLFNGLVAARSGNIKKRIVLERQVPNLPSQNYSWKIIGFIRNCIKTFTMNYFIGGMIIFSLLNAFQWYVLLLACLFIIRDILSILIIFRMAANTLNIHRTSNKDRNFLNHNA